MNKRWAIIVFILMMGCFVAVGCKKRESTKEEVYKNFQEKMVNIKEYTCIAEISASGNKSTKEYVVKHEYKKPDDYKLEVISPESLKGKIIHYTRDKIVVENKTIGDKIELPNTGRENQYMFIGDFIKNILQNENVEVKLTGNNLILRTDIPGGSKYFTTQILYVDKESKNPTKMEILDESGDTRFIIRYKDLDYKK